MISALGVANNVITHSFPVMHAQVHLRWIKYVGVITSSLGVDSLEQRVE